MTVLAIEHIDAEVMRKPAKEVKRVNASVKKLLDDMLETMRAAPGVGLAAPQIGVSKKLVVVDVGDGPYYLVNPVIVHRSAEEDIQWEGCLSFPGYVAQVKRHLAVTVKALDRDGHDIWIEAKGFLARALQHEIDHLDGIVITDRAICIKEVVQEPAELAEEGDSAVSCVFMGSPGFAVPSLQELYNHGIDIRLVVTQPDRPYGRKQELRETPVNAHAKRLGLPVVTTDSLEKPEVLELIKSQAPDFVVVVAFGQKIPNEIIELPKHACLNVHPSLLPKFRGGNPIQRAIMAGEKVSGVTTIYLSQRMDAGDICLQRSVDIDPDETFGTLEQRLSSLGAHLLLESMSLIYQGNGVRIPQDHAKKTMARHLAKGEDIIDWNQDAKRVHNLVRALNPRPGAVTFLSGQRIKIWETSVAEEYSEEGIPGRVLGVKGDSVLVSCGTGKLLISLLQPEGKKSMTAKAFLHGYRGPKDMIFTATR